MQRYAIERRQNYVLYERILRGIPCKYGPLLTFHVNAKLKIFFFPPEAETYYRL